MLSTPSARRASADTALLALRRNAMLPGFAIGAVLAACAAAVAAWAGMGEWFVAKALAVFGVGFAVVLRALPAHLPHARFGAGNALTLLRFAMASLLAAGIGESAASLPAVAWAMVVFATVTALLDAADGPLARRNRAASAFGARFDMECDALLIMVLCALVAQLDKAGPWILAAGLLRYGFVAAAKPWPWLARPLPARLQRKTICVTQIVILIVCIAPLIAPSVSRWIAAAGFAALLYSFAIDTIWLARRRHLAQELPA